MRAAVTWSQNLKSDLYRTEVDLSGIYPKGTAPVIKLADAKELQDRLSSYFEPESLLPLYTGILALRRDNPKDWKNLRESLQLRFVPDQESASGAWLDLMFLLYLDRHVDSDALDYYSRALQRGLRPDLISTLIARSCDLPAKRPTLVRSLNARIRLAILKWIALLPGSEQEIEQKGSLTAGQDSKKNPGAGQEPGKNRNPGPEPPRNEDQTPGSTEMDDGLIPQDRAAGTERQAPVENGILENGAGKQNYSRPTLGFVIPRFGEGFAGGIEYLARKVTELLESEFNIRIYTTCASNYLTWANELAVGTFYSRNVQINRFEVDHERNLPEFVSAEKNLKLRLSDSNASKKELETLTQQWIEAQGPISRTLEETLLKDARSDLDAVLFYTIQYSSTLRLLSKVRSLVPVGLVPAAHPDWTLSIPYLIHCLQAADLWITSTPEEESLLRAKLDGMGNQNSTGALPALGTPPALPGGLPVRLPGKRPQMQPVHGLEGQQFLLFVGRLDVSKGVDELIEYFLIYKSDKNRDPGLKLVLAGNAAMSIPEHPDIVMTGFVSDAELEWLYAHARALVNPSHYESLSIVLLEAWARGLPTISSGQSAVMEGQTARSQCGFCYRNREEFFLAVQSITDLSDVSRKGPSFISENYNSEVIRQNYTSALQKLITSRNDM